VKLYVDDKTIVKLNTISSELRFFLIVSDVEILPLCDKPEFNQKQWETGVGADFFASALKSDPSLVFHALFDAKYCVEMWIQVGRATHPKCIRCWHHRDDVGAHPDHPDICGRCVSNVEGPGEDRRWF
jgi:isoleucyl-tRNA synthetase